MISTTFPLFFAALSGISSAQLLARHIPTPQLEARNVSLTGGFALVPEKFCPNDLTFCGSSSTACCPTSLGCNAGAGDFDDWVCCAGTDNCGPTFDAKPYCADDTWSLWDQSQGGINAHGYFCCDVGLVGLLTGACVDPATISSPTVEALQLNPGGGVLSTATGSEVVSTSVVVTGTTIALTSLETTTATSMATLKVSSTPSSGISKAATTATAVGLSATGATTGATSSSSASASATKASTSAGTSDKAVGLGSFWVAQIAALALFASFVL